MAPRQNDNPFQPLDSPEFDEDGYPTARTLETIRGWDMMRPVSLFRFVRAAMPTYSRFTAKRLRSLNGEKFDKTEVRIATGGWSGNESVVRSLKENIGVWALAWESSHRGGLHVFSIPRMFTDKEGDIGNDPQ